MKNNLLFSLAIVVVTLTMLGCQPEVNFETDVPSKGSLQEDATGECLLKTVNGTYAPGTALSLASHTISVQINVAQTGTYTIKTDTVNGYSFSTTGVFSTPGLSTVILRGSGTPVAAGTDIFLVKYDTTTCSVPVTVQTGSAATAVFTLGGAGGTCTGATVVGTYATGTSLTTSNKITLNVNVTVAGSYNITTTHQGMIFTGTGAFTTVGPGTVELTGSGIPTTAGTNTVPVTVGASTCSVDVTVSTGATVNWRFTQGTTTYQGITSSASMMATGPFLGFFFTGTNTDGDTFLFSLGDLSGNITASENYSTATTTSNSGVFQFLKASTTDTWDANPTTTGATIIFTVTSHNTTTKTIGGTFSGNAKNGAGTILPITAGTFTITYP